eukprot:TRINITY_DN21221_c0_g1_i1.p1 TRINITY_DN21221_c0_g1~~TRINITY_DN21221_c0_g1_i1.p1  ORF type:complete len:247 (+),score=9.39 TRINITY_DN21221_c0_g1_i1:48-788(+)
MAAGYTLAFPHLSPAAAPVATSSTASYVSNVSLPQQALQETTPAPVAFVPDAFSFSDPSVRHARSFSVQASGNSSSAASFPPSPQRHHLWRSSQGSIPLAAEISDDGGRQQRCYSLRPVQRIRTLSDEMTPGGTGHYCAVFEHSWPTHPRRRVRLPTEMECAICFEVLRSGEQVQPMVHCSHLFHKHCIDALIRSGVAAAQSHEHMESSSRVRCPMCRGRMLASSISEVPDDERPHVRPLASVVSL